MKLDTHQHRSYFRLLLAETLINQVAARYISDPLVKELESELNDISQRLNAMMDSFEGGIGSEISTDEASAINTMVDLISDVIGGKGR